MFVQLKRLKIKLRDKLRYSAVAAQIIVAITLLKAFLSRSTQGRLLRFARVFRLTSAASIENSVSSKIRPQIDSGEAANWLASDTGWEQFQRSIDDPCARRSIVLKAPGPNGEKGVISLYAEADLFRVMYHVRDLSWLNKYYDLIVATSWSPLNYAAVGLALTRWEGNLYIQISNFQEIEKAKRFHPRIVTLPTLACDWLDPHAYNPRPNESRSIDILMVANWAAFKRHWVFFEALADVPASTRVTMIGQPEGKSTLATVKAQAKLFGVRQDITFFDCLSIEEVQEKQCDSRISLILSCREGSCVAVVESMFAGAPVGLLQGAVIGSSAYINDQTGVLFSPGRLGPQLRSFLERYQDFRPREWAMANVPCTSSSRKLDKVLQEHAARSGLPWTRDLAVQTWKPVPTYLHPADKETLRPAYLELKDRFPRVFHLISQEQ